VAISGIVASDRLLVLGHGDDLLERFVAALEKEFSDSDGSILPI